MKRFSFPVQTVIALAAMMVGFTPAQAADTVAPTVPDALAVTATATASVSLSWTASTDNVAVTAYLLERCTGAGCSNFAQIASITSTSYINTALAVSTSYSYRVRARDAANNKSAYSTVVTTTTLADTQAPTAPTGVSVAVVSNTQLTVSWVASTDDVKVTGYLVERCLGVTCSTFAQVATPTTLTYNNTALVPATSYSYRVRAKDAANNLSPYSSIASASTLPDTQAPTAPTNVTLTVASSTKITVAWTASTDDVKVTGYRVERCQGVGCTTFTQVATSTGTSYANTGLVAGSSYSYRVSANDATGNVSDYSATVTASTTGADVTVPTVPTSLNSTATSSTQVNLTWIASTDNVAVTAYRVERCQGTSCTTFAQIGTTATLTYNDAGLSPSTPYRYRVRAVDAANNVSAYSTISSVTTAAPDTQAPSAPSGLTGTASSPTQINLSWTASTDNTGVTNYLIERCQGSNCVSYAQITSTTTTTFNDTGLASGVSYSYRVKAIDAANNASAYSSPTSATTQYTGPITYNYTYDQLGRITHASGSDGSSIDYQYDANGNVTTISRQ